MDASPIFEACEEIFDFVALPVEGFVEVSREYPALSRRDTGGNAFGFQGSAVFVAVIAFVADHHARSLGKRRIKQLCADMIAHLAFGQTQRNGPALAITHSMEFGVQAAFGAPDTSG